MHATGFFGAQIGTERLPAGQELRHRQLHCHRGIAGGLESSTSCISAGQSY